MYLAFVMPLVRHRENALDMGAIWMEDRSDYTEFLEMPFDLTGVDNEQFCHR